jgi:hypothetical protein
MGAPNSRVWAEAHLQRPAIKSGRAVAPSLADLSARSWNQIKSLSWDRIFSERHLMGESASTPAFEVRSLKSASGWYVRVAWPDGKRDHIPGFTTRQEAQRWIEVKAPAWLSESCGAPKAFGLFATS